MRTMDQAARRASTSRRCVASTLGVLLLVTASSACGATGAPRGSGWAQQPAPQAQPQPLPHPQPASQPQPEPQPAPLQQPQPRPEPQPAPEPQPHVTPQPRPAPAQPARRFQDLIAKARQQGTLRIIVGVAAPFRPEGELTEAEAQAQRQRIAAAQQRVLGRLAGRNVSNVTRFETIPSMSMTVDAAALEVLAADPDVRSVQEDTPVPPTRSGGGLSRPN